MRFPNLYTIRGTSYRDSKSWYKSVDAMRSYQPQYLISCHGPFLTGEDVIEERLSIYRDAIQFIHDYACLLYTSPSPRDLSTSRMPSSA